MTIAQPVFKFVARKKQTALGSPASGSGGLTLRRRSMPFNKAVTTFANDELTSHMQDTGITFGGRSTSARYDGILSPLTFQPEIEVLLRKDFAATAPLTLADVTAAATAPMFSTAAGDFLAAGLKIFDVIRMTGWTTTGATNNARNFWILSLTAGFMSGVFLDDPLATVAAKASGDSVVFTVVGKKAWVPTTAHTNQFLTYEEWQSDITRSRVYQDCKIGTMTFTIPADGNCTLGFDVVGLGKRTKSGTRVLTSPTGETTTQPVQAAQGRIALNNAVVGDIMSITATINSGMAPMGPSIGTREGSDVLQGTTKVSGTITARMTGESWSDVLDNETNVAIGVVAMSDTTATADFIALAMTRVKITGDTPSDGGNQEVRLTLPFTAEINGAGGALLANLQTIVSIQDSAVV